MKEKSGTPMDILMGEVGHIPNGISALENGRYLSRLPFLRRDSIQHYINRNASCLRVKDHQNRGKRLQISQTRPPYPSRSPTNQTRQSRRRREVTRHLTTRLCSLITKPPAMHYYHGSPASKMTGRCLGENPGSIRLPCRTRKSWHTSCQDEHTKYGSPKSCCNKHAFQP